MIYKKKVEDKLKERRRGISKYRRDVEKGLAIQSQEDKRMQWREIYTDGSYAEDIAGMGVWGEEGIQIGGGWKVWGDQCT